MGIGARDKLCQVGEPELVAQQLAVVVRCDALRGQSDLVQHGPELVAGTCVVGAQFGRLPAGGRATEYDVEAGGENIREHRGARRRRAAQVRHSHTSPASASRAVPKIVKPRRCRIVVEGLLSGSVNATSTMPGTAARAMARSCVAVRVA